MNKINKLGFIVDLTTIQDKKYLSSELKQYKTLYHDDYILINLEGLSIKILKDEANTSNFCDYCILISLKHHADSYDIKKFLDSEEFLNSLEKIQLDYETDNTINNEEIEYLQHLADENIETSLEYMMNNNEKQQQ